MPNIDDMQGPSRYISYRDLEPNKLYVGTIHSVQLEAAANKPNAARNPGYQGQANASVKGEWIMWFIEWQKPYKLRDAKLRLLGALLKEKATENWGGKKVLFYRGHTDIGGELKESINIDNRPTMPGMTLYTESGLVTASAALPAGTAPAGLLAMGKLKVKIPSDAIEKFSARIGKHQKKWDHFLAWIKDESPEGHTLIAGHSLDDISGAVLPAMVAYVAWLEAPPPAEPGFEPIEEEDIPF